MVSEKAFAYQPGRILILDALRGVAALLVLWHHVMKLHPADMATWLAASPWSWQIAQLLSDQNKRAVLLFFVLSGIAIRLAIRAPLYEGPALREYARRRAVRILPLYWFSLAWTFVLGLAAGTIGASYGLYTLTGNLLFLQNSQWGKGNWFVPYGDNGPYWSLSYEVFYYILIALILFVLGKRMERLRDPVFWLSLFAAFASVAAIGLMDFLPIPQMSFLGLWLVWMLGFLIADRHLGKRTQLVVLPFLLLPLCAQLILSFLGYRSATLGLLLDGTVIACLLAMGFMSPGRFRAAIGLCTAACCHG